MKNIRGLVLTSKGKKIGKRLVFRHDLLEQFLKIIGVKDENIYHDVEGIEHHLSWDSIDRIGDLVQYFEEDQKRIQDLRNVQKRNEEEQNYKKKAAANSVTAFFLFIITCC